MRQRRRAARGRPWPVVFTSQARRDARKAARAGLRPRIDDLIEILRRDPFTAPPPFEKLLGDLAGACSRRINLQHRLVFQVLSAERTVKVLRLWTHYE